MNILEGFNILITLKLSLFGTDRPQQRPEIKKLQQCQSISWGHASSHRRMGSIKGWQFGVTWDEKLGFESMAANQLCQLS